MSTLWRWSVGALALATCALSAVAIALIVAVCAVRYPVEQLSADSSGPLRITDRRGAVLRAVPADAGRPGRHAWVALNDVPALTVLTMIASEDERFFRHGGVDPVGVARAVWLDIKERRLGYGGSTITMQLVRMIHSAGKPRAMRTKLRETILALRLERAVDKRTILEQYVNRAYFANGAYGIEAAAQTYFAKPARALSAGEATLLAVVPRAPTAYDPIAHLPAALRRRDHVLDLLVDRGVLTADQVDRARAEPIAPRLSAPPFRAPHFSDWVVSELPADVRRRGGVVRTTLDLELQRRLEQQVAAHVADLGERNLAQAGVVVIDSETAQVLAMVGSTDFSAHDGQLNIAVRRRHPGSALKPFIYALAIEGGDSPATIAYDIRDVPSAYRARGARQPERGPVRYREALAGSYNLAAIHTLEKVGVDRMLDALRRAGVGPLDGTPDEYGLRLALGSARVRLIDLAASYRFLVRGGRVRSPGAVIAVTSPGGTAWRPPRARERRIFSEQTSWLVMDMLSDETARRPAFGQDLPVDLPFPIAAKTGTSRGFADTVAVAATNEVIVAAWAGNFDGKPTNGLQAMESAAPLVRAALLAASERRPLTLPSPPDGIETAQVCPLSGLLPGPACPHRKRDHFRAGSVPTQTCNWHRHEGDAIAVAYPSEVQAWAQRDGKRR